MLSNETAVGQFPIPAVETMCRIIESAEESNKPETQTCGSGQVGNLEELVARFAKLRRLLRRKWEYE